MTNESIDEPGADGLTVREAITRRVFLGVEELVFIRESGGMTTGQMALALDVLVRATSPWLTREGLDLLTETGRQVEQQARLEREVVEELHGGEWA